MTGSAGAAPRIAHGWTTVSVGVVVALSAIAVGTYFTTEKTNYRELAEVIRATPAADTVVIGPVDRRWQSSIQDYLHWRAWTARSSRRRRSRSAPR